MKPEDKPTHVYAMVRFPVSEVVEHPYPKGLGLSGTMLDTRSVVGYATADLPEKLTWDMQEAGLISRDKAIEFCMNVQKLYHAIKVECFLDVKPYSR